MDIVLLLSGFFGLAAAFVASALWATRPASTVATNERLVAREPQRTTRSRRAA